MEICFWHGLQDGPVLNSFKQIVHEWNIEHANAQVVLKDFPEYGTPAELALSQPDQNQPNLVLAPEYLTSTMMSALKSHKVIPINKLIDREQLNKIADIVKLTFGDPNGNLVSLPFNPACGILYTNQKLLQLIGKSPDWIPKSIEELEAVCMELVDKGIVAYGYTCAWPAAYLIEVPAAQQNLPLVYPDNGKLGYGEYQLSQAHIKRHVFELRDQIKARIFVYSGKTNLSRKPFIEGNVAFYMQGSTHFTQLQREAAAAQNPFTVGCGPLPTLTCGQQEKFAYPLGGASIWVLDNTTTNKMIENVRAFLTYLAQDTIQERWHKETGYVPVLKTIPEKLKEFYKDHPLHSAVVQQTLQDPLGTYSLGIHLPNYAEARKEMFELIEQIVDLKTSDEQVDKLLQDFDCKFSVGKSVDSSP